MHIAFRLDASVAIGSGHLMRCLALANALVRGGAVVTFVMRCDIAALQAEIERHGHRQVLLPMDGNEDPAADALQTQACLHGMPAIDWLVVDHYRLDAHWEQLMRPYAKRIMAIDDLANRPHDCDILLDQNLYLELDGRYTGLLPAHCRVLLGPGFAILRTEFLLARAGLRTRDGAVHRATVFFGGTDPTGATMRTLGVIVASPQLCQIQWDVIVGAANPQAEQIEQLCSRHASLNFHCQISNMAQMMAASDLCVGAGGTALWERAVLGVPGIVVAVAANQISGSVAMARHGALLYLGTDELLQNDKLQEAMLFACSNMWLLQSLSVRGMEVVDGKGVDRIVAVMSEQYARHHANQ